MDTGLRDSRPHFVLSRSAIPDGRVPSLPIIEHLDVFKDILLGFVSGAVVPMVDQLTLERSKETLDGACKINCVTGYHASSREEGGFDDQARHENGCVVG